MAAPSYRNPRADAIANLPPGHDARILEPSPPANSDPQWFADDPTDPGGAVGTLVTPIEGEGTPWDELAITRPELVGFIRTHWLGNHARLAALPEDFEQTRRALHQLAFFAIAPKRHAANGKIGLRYTHGGFGTPFFGSDEQVRVERGWLVHQIGEEVKHRPVSTLREACDFLTVSYREVWFEGFHDPPSPVGPDTGFAISEAAAAAVGDWFGFGASVLEQARRTPGAAEVSRVQLWPEHFDLAFEMGSSAERGSYGASPGDEHHPEPYFYVAAWEPVNREDSFWNDVSFNGASLSFGDLIAADNPRATALDFIERGYGKLTGST